MAKAPRLCLRTSSRSHVKSKPEDDPAPPLNPATAASPRWTKSRLCPGRSKRSGACSPHAARRALTAAVMPDYTEALATIREQVAGPVDLISSRSRGAQGSCRRDPLAQRIGSGPGAGRPPGNHRGASHSGCDAAERRAQGFQGAPGRTAHHIRQYQARPEAPAQRRRSDQGAQRFD